LKKREGKGRDVGFGEGGIRDGEIGKRHFEREGMNRLFIVYVKLEKHVWSQCPLH
jgi:hypothetical protein